MGTVFRAVLWTVLFHHQTRSQEESCDNKLGMKSKRIPDESITATASSNKSDDHFPSFARVDSPKAWCSKPEDDSPYIQIQLDEPKLITAITTQGSEFDLIWSRKYEVKYLEKGSWKSYKEELIGNVNIRALRTNVLDPAVRTQTIRIYPKEPFSVMDTTNSIPSCLRLALCSALCSDPGEPKNGVRIGDDFGDGHMVAYRCNENFSLVGSYNSYCAAGQWNSTKPTCKASCPNPGMPQNGRRIGSNFAHGQKVTFVCFQKYTLMGSQLMTCYDGQWNSTVPVCKAPSPPTTTPTPSPTPATCKAKADVAFLVDSSGSIGRSRWPKLLDFLKRVISEFDVGPDGTHIAVVAYSTNANLEFTFNTLSGAQITAEEYGKLIDRIGFQRGFTYIDRALILADEQVFRTAAGMRPEVSQIAILITDGQQTTTREYTPLDIASKRIKDKGVEVFSLGIGSYVNTDQLRQIASSNDTVFFSAGFDELIGIVKPIVQKSCSIRPPPTTLPPTTPKPTEFVCKAVADVAFIVDSSGSIGVRNWPKMLQFLKDMVKAFNVGPDKTHIAVIAYSTRANVEFTFDRLKGSQITETGYYQLIDRIRFQRGFTFIDKAVMLADQQIFIRAAGMRPELPQIAIVITDGKQTTTRGPFIELSDASSGLKLKKVQVYSLGIGQNLDKQQLKDIASSKDKVFYATGFAELATVAQEIVKNSCPGR